MRFYPSHQQCRFRAFLSLEYGVAWYLRKLATDYPAALRAAESGDADKFVRRLHSGGYFTAHVDQYAELVVRIAASYQSIADATAQRWAVESAAKRLRSWFSNLFRDVGWF